MTRDSSQSNERTTRRQRGAFALIAVVCILVAGAAVVTAQQQTFIDDFEDGDVDGWEEPQRGTHPVISTESVEGDYSQYGNTTLVTENGTPNNAALEWVDGPQLNMSEGFTVTGVFKPDWVNDNDRSIRLGLAGDYQYQDGENAFIQFHRGLGQTWIGTSVGESSDDRINDHFEGTWVNFVLESYAGNDTLRANVWEHGTAEPSGWQLEMDTLDQPQPGRFGVNPGFGTGTPREYWLDEVALEGETVNDSEDLRLDVPKYLQHNSSSHYSVEANQSGTWEDVTDSATVTPSNTDALTFYPDNQTVVAGGNKTINERVNVTATYDGLTATGSTVVATPTVDNLDLLPAWWSVNALLSDWTVIWILMATLIATAATRMATTFAGIGAFVMAMVMGWIMGDVPNGIMVATTFMGIFIGLNLAANIDYSVR